MRPLDLILANATLGPIPGWAVMVLVAGFHVALVVTALHGGDRGGDEVHV